MFLFSCAAGRMRRPGGRNKEEMTMTTEELRRRLLEEIYAGAMAGMGAMILDEDRIRRADDKELREIAAQYGYR